MAEEKIEGLDDLLDDNIGTYHVGEADTYFLRPVKDMGRAARHEQRTAQHEAQQDNEQQPGDVGQERRGDPGVRPMEIAGRGRVIALDIAHDACRRPAYNGGTDYDQDDQQATETRLA
jgi:hypothetical protein